MATDMAANGKGNGDWYGAGNGYGYGAGNGNGYGYSNTAKQ
jgi:hypothetical protein